jgi:DNA-binding GntR family transcriptional regulator
VVSRTARERELHLLSRYARSGQIPVRRDTDHHAQIFEAVRAGDAEAARLAMQGYLQWVRDRL